MDKHEFTLLLQRFFISLEERDDAVFSMSAADLTVQENMDVLIRTYAPLLKAKEAAAAGVYFAGWFSYVALFLQYCVSAMNAAPDLSLSNLTIQLRPVKQYYQFSFVQTNWVEEEAPADEDERCNWRRRVFADFYGNTVRPLFEAASVSIGLDAGQLWGQLPTKFNYYLDVFMNDAENTRLRQRLRKDYEDLKHGVGASVFGRHKNPFDVKIRYLEDPYDSCKQVKMKNVCCLYYLTDEGEYCYTCPRLKEAERIARRNRLRTQ